MNADMKDVLTPEQLVSRWHNEITLKTLANWRSMGKGPKFFRPNGGKRGKILYRLAEVLRIEESGKGHTGE